MTDSQEPIHDVAQLGHFEIFTPKPDESVWFFKEILGMEETDRQGQSVYMRAWGDYDHNTLKITEARQAGLGHVGLRTWSPQALDRRVRALQAAGCGKGWIEGLTSIGFLVRPLRGRVEEGNQGTPQYHLDK